MPVIYHERAIYQGRKEIPVIKVSRINGKMHTDSEVIKIFLEEPEPGSYLSDHRYFKDVQIRELDDYYSLVYSGVYKGEMFKLDAVDYSAGVVRITTGDNRGERCEELKEIGVDGQYYDRGMIYHKMLPPEALDRIIRKKHSYFTKQTEERTVSADEFWAEVLEARTYIEKR